MRDLALLPVAEAARRQREHWYEMLPRQIGSATSGVTVTANSSAHTKGSWAELIASTASDAAGLIVTVYGVGASAQDTATLLDIGVGSAGNERTIIPNVGVGGASTSSPSWVGITFTVPVFIPAGSRVAARIQSVVAGGKTATVQAQLMTAPNAHRSPRTTITIGSSAATSAGTAMSAVADTWVEITPALSAALAGIVIVPSISTNGMTGAASANLVTVGAGPSGGEVALGTLSLQVSSQELVGTGASGGLGTIFAADLAAGMRLAARCNLASAGLDVTIIGIPRTA